MLCAGLTGFGFSVAEASSYAEAQAQLEAGDIPPVAIVDFIRNNESAQGFVTLLRDTPDYQSIKVIVATINTLTTEEQSALGVDAVMVKPVDLSQLVKAVYLFHRPSRTN
jgi:CheY-like chemotaxis protein